MKPRFPRSPVVWVGLAITVVVLVALVYSSGQAPASPPMPDPNGYDDFVQAAESIQGSPGDFPTLDLASLRTLVTTNAEPLRRLRLGLSRPCYYLMGADLTNAGMSQLALMKRSVQLLAAEGKLHELEGQPAAAADSYVEAIRFGNEMSRGGMLITRLVGIACEAIGYSPLGKLVPQLGGADARRVASALEKVDADRAPWSEVFVNERRYHRLMKITPATHPLLCLVGWWQSRTVTAKAEVRQKTVLAHERLLIAELALRAYSAETGHAPARLEELTNRFIARLPLDPFAAQPLIYRPQGTNWLLYSVGADGVDDGGKRVGKALGAKGDLFFDSP